MLSADVRDPEALKVAVESVIARHGRIDVLINNAGFGFRGAIEETSVEQAQKLFETNFFGVLSTTNAVLPFMRKQEAGLIINIGSIAGLVALPYNGIYSASKFALEGFTQALRLEVEQFGINVAMINPGFIVTKFAHSAEYVKGMNEYAGLRQKAQERIENGLGQGPDPDVVTEAIIELIEEGVSEANFIVGEDANAMLDDWNELSPDEFTAKLKEDYGL
jgi:short-subunit dehydrogenase